MADQIVTQKFNDDLLLNLDVRENARLAFPSMFHVPDDEELRALIETFEKPADRAKRQSLRAGIMAVLLVVIALFVTSAERLYEDYPWSGVAATGAGILGAVGVLIGVFGLIIGKAKKERLCQRMASELLRQFHFQIFVCRTIDVFKSLTGKTEQDLFLKQKKFGCLNLKFVFYPILRRSCTPCYKGTKVPAFGYILRQACRMIPF